MIRAVAVDLKLKCAKRSISAFLESISNGKKGKVVVGADKCGQNPAVHHYLSVVHCSLVFGLDKSSAQSTMYIIMYMYK